MSGEEFWVVWCPQACSPTARHQSGESALREAQRLAAQCPEKDFFVLRAEARARGAVQVAVESLGGGALAISVTKAL